MVHLGLWQGDPGAVGLSPSQVAGFADRLAAFDAARAAAENARELSLAATVKLRDAADSLRGGGGVLLALIKAFAASTGDVSVYPNAGVSRPDPARGVMPPPEPPTGQTFTINNDGSLTLRWKAKQPRGVVGVQYMISRRLPGERGFTLLGIAGSVKRFTDTTLPAGVASAEYQIRPHRGGRGGRGEALGPVGNTIVVQFGVSGLGSAGMMGRMAA